MSGSTSGSNGSSDPAIAPPPRPPAPPERLRPFEFAARLIRQSFRSWWRVLPWLLAPALLLALPTIPYDLDEFRAQLAAPTPPPLTDLRHPWTIVVHLFATVMLQGAAATIVFAQWRGEPLALAPLLRALARMAIPIVATALLLFAILLVWMVPGLVAGSVWPPAAALLLLATWPFVTYSLATAVVAVERRPPLTAMRRSHELTHGARSAVLLALTAAALAGVGVVIAVESIAGSLPTHPLLQFNLSLVSMLVTETFDAVLVANLYLALRIRKEPAP